MGNTSTFTRHLGAPATFPKRGRGREPGRGKDKKVGEEKMLPPAEVSQESENLPNVDIDGLTALQDPGCGADPPGEGVMTLHGNRGYRVVPSEPSWPAPGHLTKTASEGDLIEDKYHEVCTRPRSHTLPRLSKCSAMPAPTHGQSATLKGLPSAQRRLPVCPVEPSMTYRGAVESMMRAT